jgi:phosphatidate cytidylyltransferase
MPGGSGVSVQSSKAQDGKGSGLGLRIGSALVLTPVAVAAVWFGAPYFDILLLVFSWAMIWEWQRMCTPSRQIILGVIGGAGLLGAMILEWQMPGPVVLLPVVVSALLSFILGAEERFLCAFGAVYIPVAALAAQWMRSFHADGLLLIMWLFFLIWATDTGAYAFGRAIGGPKLAPRFSPKKTWAGLIGGMLCAGIVGAVVVFCLGGDHVWMVALTSAVLAIVAQIGDLGESALKRRFNVKDSSNLIPGHGGFLDRADGMLSVLPVGFVIIYFFGLSLS